MLSQEHRHLLERERVGGILGGDHRAGALALLRVGQADDRDVADLGVGVEHVLDLLGADVLALADDDVLEPAGDGDVAVGVDVAQVARAEPPLVVEGIGVERAVEVAAEELRTDDTDLALLARASRLPVEPDDAHLHALGRRALGVRQLVVRICRASHREDRALREPVARDDADAADLGLEVVVELRGLGRPAARERPHVGEQRRRRVLALGGEVGEVERRARAGEGRVLALHERDRRRGIEGLDHQVPHADDEPRQQPHDAADVGEREHEGADVVGPQIEGRVHTDGRCHHRAVGVRRVAGRVALRRLRQPVDLLLVRRQRQQRHQLAAGHRVPQPYCPVAVCAGKR